MVALTAKQRRAQEKRRRHNDELGEFRSHPGQGRVLVTCAEGHSEMRSHTRFDKKGRAVSVLWTCEHSGCQKRFEVNPTKWRKEEEARMAKLYGKA